MTQRHTIVAEMTTKCSRAAVWAYLTSRNNLRALVQSTLNADVAFGSAHDAQEARRRPIFRAHISNDDLLLSAKDCSVAFRIIAEAHHTQMIAAASFDDQASVQPTKQSLNRMLDTIRTHAEAASGAAEPPAKILPPFQDDADRVAVQDNELAGKNLYKNTQTAGTASKRTKSGSRAAFWGIAAALVFVLIAVLLLPLLQSDPSAGNVLPEGYSDKVTLENVISLQVGNRESDVREVLGTHGVATAGGRLYIGKSSEENRYDILVNIQYENGEAQKITFLNTAQCLASDPFRTPFDYPSAYDTMSDVSSIEDVIGQPASMIRLYRQGEADITEIHFGYLDPFSNFNAAWRGEYVVVQDKQNNVARVEHWAVTGGGDPLIVAQLEGNPVEYQYDDYTAFLRDKYAFEKALLMLAAYSHGDVRTLFGEYALYSTDAGVALNLLESEEKLADGTPAYRMSFGFDSRGRFVICSFTNMRILNKAGMLSGTRYTEITRGMSYGEVRALMGILPSSVVIDNDYYILCYGESLGREVFEEQFEYMVKIDKDTHYVQNMWDNTARDW